MGIPTSHYFQSRPSAKNNPSMKSTAAASQLIMSVTSPLGVSVLREVAGPAMAARRSAQLYPLISARAASRRPGSPPFSPFLSFPFEVELPPTRQTDRKSVV